MSDRPARTAIYVRVSSLDQQPENQLRKLREYCGRESGRVGSTSITASVGPKSGVQLSTRCCKMPGGGDSIASSSGGWTGRRRGDEYLMDTAHNTFW
jgi:hypothetical protein